MSVTTLGSNPKKAVEQALAGVKSKTKVMYINHHDWNELTSLVNYDWLQKWIHNPLVILTDQIKAGTVEVYPKLQPKYELTDAEKRQHANRR